MNLAVCEGFEWMSGKGLWFFTTNLIPDFLIACTLIPDFMIACTLMPHFLIACTLKPDFLIDCTLMPHFLIACTLMPHFLIACTLMLHFQIAYTLMPHFLIACTLMPTSNTKVFRHLPLAVCSINQFIVTVQTSFQLSVVENDVAENNDKHR